MENVTARNPPYPSDFMAHHAQHTFVQGLLHEQITCPDIVRAFLLDFCGLGKIYILLFIFFFFLFSLLIIVVFYLSYAGSVLWARGVDAMDLIPEAQWNALCYQNKAFKIYVQSLHKGGGGYKIFDVSGNKSRYNPQAPVSTTIATLTKPSALLGTPPFTYR